MRVTFLGTGAPLHPTRAATAMLLRADGAPPLLIDLGGGLELARGLHAAGVALGELGDVVVTHRHGDHIGGALALCLGGRVLRLHGPADALAGVEALVATGYGELDAARSCFECCVMEDGDTRELDGWTVEAFAVEHRVPTVAVRVTRGGRVFAFGADCRPCAGLVACARGADLFVCDALCESTNAKAAQCVGLMHPTAKEAGEAAADAGAERLALTHLARFADEGAVVAEAAAAFGGAVVLPGDGETLVV